MGRLQTGSGPRRPPRGARDVAWQRNSRAGSLPPPGSSLAKRRESAESPDRRKPLREGHENENAERRTSRRFVLTRLSRLDARQKSAPRAVRHSHHGFTELGAYELNRLRRTPVYTFYPWNARPAIEKSPPATCKSSRDPLMLARYYQSLLDTGRFESRAALARFLGVSRARVTQVLNRLKSPPNASGPPSSSAEGTSDVA
jgi:hypothetical protein